MTDRVRLHRLAFAVVEGRAELPFFWAADQIAGAPEVECVRLVPSVFERVGDLSFFHLVKHLAGELEVEALVIDRPAAIAHDEDAVVGGGDQVFDTPRFVSLGASETLGIR